MLGFLALGVVRTARRSIGPWPAWSDRPRASRFRLAGSVGLRAYLDVLVPVVLLVKTPDLLGAPWTTLVRIDLGLVIAALAAVRVADGVVRVTRLGVAWRRLARAGALPAEPVSARLPGVPAGR